MKKIFTTLLALAATGCVYAQQPPDGLKISGYVQVQNQWADGLAPLKVGAVNDDFGESFNRFGIRRGRLKFTYTTGLASAVFQIDATDKGLGFKDAYLDLRDPWIGSMAFRGGIFDRPFGYEISYSSSARESPERSTIFQTLFPEERDLGAMLVLQAPASSPWSVLKLEAGLFAGNGIKQESDDRRDFIGHLSARKAWEAVSLGGGVSYYRGSVYQGTQNIYTMQNGAFVVDSDPDNVGRYARREYFGADAELTFRSSLGATKLHGEYLFGRQPGGRDRTTSPNASVRLATDTYLRDFEGGYVMLVQQLGQAPVSLTGKYDWYDPNTAVSGSPVADPQPGLVPADLARYTVGFGALWEFDPGMRLTAWYDLSRNEGADYDDDVFTLRLQYKF